MRGSDDGRSNRRRHRWPALTGYAVMGLASVLILGASGYAWTQLSDGITKSDVLKSIPEPKAATATPKTPNPDTNILIMGLDTRLDENGDPLPTDIYNALHAGDQTDGGNNSNVLMLLHVPGDGSKATSISIPRDDYASLAGCPDGECMGKIKQAYGLAFDQQSRSIPAGTDKVQREQEERDAGRRAEIQTVSQFLGGVPIDHFVEVTLVAFFQIAQVVQPITVCLNQATQDDFSGANFHQGQQQINASQALAFVRQRRDNVHPELNFTDLDRERRQQAFIASLAYQLMQSGTFTDPAKLQAIFDVAKQNVAIDSGLDLLSFAQQATNLTHGNITFYTLPIDHFGTDPLGEDVNFVDLPLIQSTVHQLLSPPVPTSTSTPTPTSSAPPPTAVVDVTNASGRAGLATEVSHGLVAHGFTGGTLATQAIVRTSAIEYGAGASAAAGSIATLLGGGISTAPSTTVPAGQVRVVLGSDFILSPSLTGASTATSTTPPPATAVPATGGGVAGPPPTVLSALSGGGIPCVK